MIIDKNEQIHVMYRALYENSIRRHFLGVVRRVEGALCRAEGYVFIYDKAASTYVRRPGKRTTILDLAESGYIVNVIDDAVNIDEVEYRYVSGSGLTATDNKGFSLNINEYGLKD